MNKLLLIKLNKKNNLKKKSKEKITEQDVKLIKFWNNYWNYLHWLTINYPNKPNSEDKNQILDLVEEMRTYGLRCLDCRLEFDNWLIKNDINKSLNSKDKLFEYFFKLHNNINKKNNKKIYSLDEAKKIYNNPKWKNYFNKKFNIDILELFISRKLKNFPNLYNLSY